MIADETTRVEEEEEEEERRRIEGGGGGAGGWGRGAGEAGEVENDQVLVCQDHFEQAKKRKSSSSRRRGRSRV